MRSSTASTRCSARTARRCNTIGATCSRSSSWSTWLARSSGSAVSGPRAYIALLQGRDQHDPLFLQVKEATRSVLEDHLPKSRYRQPGERVVHGQRMMQASSDIFLGWTKGIEDNRFLYLRQLRDMKGSVDVEVLRPFGMNLYAGICGQTLARARTPDRAIGSPRLRTSGKAIASTYRSPTSRRDTPTRTSATTRRSAGRSKRSARGTRRRLTAASRRLRGARYAARSRPTSVAMSYCSKAST